MINRIVRRRKRKPTSSKGVLMSTSEDSSDDMLRNAKHKSSKSKSKKKDNLDDLTEDFFEEDSTTSDDDGDFKADKLDLSSSTDSNDKNNSDVDMQSSDEDELLKFYDKKLRDKVSTKKKKGGGDETEDVMTSKIADYMKKMRNDEKKLSVKMESGDAKLSPRELAKNRRNKEDILKKFDYKMDHLKPMKGKNFMPKFDSSETETSDSDSEFQNLADRMSKINTSKSAKTSSSKPSANKIKMPDMKKKATSSRDLDLQKQLAEMKKLVGSPKTSDPMMDSHLIKAKQRVSDWMKEEEEKTNALKERLSAASKFPTENMMGEGSQRSFRKGLGDLTKTTEMKGSLPPLKSKKTSSTMASLRKDELLSLMTEDPSKLRSKTRTTTDKPRYSVPSPVRSKVPTTKATSGIGAPRLGQTKAEPTKLTAKPPAAAKISTSTASKVPERKVPTKKAPAIKRNAAI